MKPIITKIGKHDWFIKKSINKKFSLPLVTFGKLIQSSALGKVLRTTLALILTIGLIPHTQLRAYAQDSNSQFANSNEQSQYSNNEQANYALVVENGTIENTEDGTIPAYSLVFTYSESEPETYEGHEVVAAYTDFLNCDYDYDVPWSSFRSNINQVTFANVTRPQSTVSWFCDFQYLTTINGIENFDTSNVTNMKYMFCGCSSLTNLDLSSFDTSNAISMGYMFWGCLSLISLDLSSFDTSNVQNMEGMFYVCPSLINLDLSSFDTSNVQNMEAMFHSCSSLTNIDVSSFNTSNVTSMDFMFWGCSSLTKLDVSSFDTSNVTNMKYMFSGNTNLDTIAVSNLWDTSQATYSSDMFKDCTSLKGGCGTVYDPNYIDKAYARIDEGEDNPGYFCVPANYALVVENGGIENTEGGTIPAYRLVFTNCESKPETYEGNNVVAAYTDFLNCDSYAPWDSYRSNINQVTFANFTRPRSTAFWCYGFTNLTTISGIENLDTSNVKDVEGMFNNCPSLTNLDVSNFNTSNVQNMECMFCNCSSLTNLDISSFNTSNVLDMKYMFSGNTKLETIVVSELWDTSQVIDSLDMFKDCTSLKGECGTVYDPNYTDGTYAHIDGGKNNPGYFCDQSFIPANYVLVVENGDIKNTEGGIIPAYHLVFTYSESEPETYEGHKVVAAYTDFLHDNYYAPWDSYNTKITQVTFANVTCPQLTALWFYGCSNLTTINGIEKLDISNVSEMYEMFYGCSSLTSLDVSNFNTSNVRDMEGMFWGCSNLTNLDVSNFDTSNVESMYHMFSGCSNLTNLNISSIDTSSVRNMEGMFNGCSSLTYLDLSWFNTSNVEYMCYMFNDCSKLVCLDVSSFDTSKVKDMEGMFKCDTKLEAIVASDLWDMSQVINSSYMFEDCKSLRGECGTCYNLLKTDGTYAHIDEGKSNPGYFCLQANISANYALVVENGTIENTEGGTSSAYCLVFTHCDDNPETYEGHKVVAAYTDFKNCMYSVTPWGWYKSNITQITFTNVTRPQSTQAWFYDFKNLTTINGIEKLDTCNVKDMEYMFYGCSSLTNLDVSSFDTSNVESMFHMFSGCSNLTNLNISSIDTSSVRNMEGMFNNCSSLTNLDVSGFNTSNVEYMRSMFYNCSSLTNLDVSGFDTSNIRDMDSMFYGCSSLTNLDVSGFDTSYVYGMEYMFYGCSSLTNLNLSSFDTSNVTNMKYMFDGCSSLTNLDVSSFLTSNVKYMHYMFKGCSKLVNLDVSTFDTSNVTDMKYMFDGCSSLTNLDVSSFLTSNVKYMHYMFKGCSNLTNLNLSSFDTSNVTNTKYMFSGNTKLETIVVSKLWDMCLVADSSCMFKDCTSLKGSRGTVYDSSKTDGTYARIDEGEDKPGYFCDSSNIPVNVPANYALVVENGDIENTEGGTTPAYHLVFTYSKSKPETFEGHEVVAAYTDFLNCDYYAPWDSYKTKITQVTFANVTRPQSTALWFYGFESLTTINGIENLDTRNVTNMKYMFDGCSSLTNLNLSSFNTSNVINMGFMFYNCSSLINLDVSSFDTSNVQNMERIFHGCSSLTNIDVSNFNTSNILDAEDMFWGCSSITSLDVSSFDTSNVKKMTYMFYGCSSLTNLDLSSFDTSSVTNMKYMFNGCSSLTNLDLSSFNTSNVQYMYYMFNGCSSLTNLDLSSFNTSNVLDMKYMFSGNTRLETIVVSELWNTSQVTDSSDMFKDCTSLKGECGTVYDPYYIDKTYARIDEGEDNPGYFCDSSHVPVSVPANYALVVENRSIERNYCVLTPTYRLVFTNCESKPTSYEGCRVVAAYQVFQYAQKVPWLSFADFITKVDFDKAVSPTSTANWFSHFHHLTQVNGLRNLDTSKTTSMQNMFFHCANLSNLDLSGFNTSNVTDMRHMFEGCGRLSSLDVSSFDTSNVTNMDGMFSHCANLSNLDLSGFNTSNVTDMRHMFEGCGRLTSLDVSSFDTSNVTNMDGMFSHCGRLTSLDLSSFNTILVKDMRHMFCNDGDLTTIYVSSGLWDICNCKKTDMMFRDCFNLKGSKGTVYNPRKTDGTYARIDGGSDRPGYFSQLI